MSKQAFLTNVILNKVGVIAQIIIAFVLTPILVSSLGNEKYGIWTIVAGLSGYLSLLDFGISSAIIRFVSRYQSENRPERINQIVSTSLAIFLILGAILIALGPVIAHFFVNFFDFTPQLSATIKILVMLVTLDVTVFVLNGVFRGALEGQQRFDISMYVHVASAIYKAALCIIVLHYGFELIALSTISITANVLSTLYLFYYLRKNYSHIIYNLKLANKKDAHKITSYGKNTFVGMIANQIIYYSDTFIIAFFLNSSAVAFYAIPWSLMEYMRQLFFSASRTFVPNFSFNQENVTNNHDLYIKGTRLLLILTNLLCIGMIAFGEAFIHIWISPEYAETGKYLIVIFFIGLMIQAPQMISYSLLQGLSEHKTYSNYSLIMSGANLALSIIFIKTYGLVGVAIGAAIPQAIFYGIFVPLHTHKKIKMKTRFYFKKVYVPHILPSLTLLLCAYYIQSIIPPTSYLTLLTGAIIATFIYFIVCFFCVLSFEEKETIILKAQKFQKKNIYE